MTPKRIKQVLGSSELFADAAIDQDAFIPLSFRKGQIISDQIDQQPAIGIIAKGSVDVYSVSCDGCEVILSHLTQGNTFGICNVFAPAPLETVLKCTIGCDILFIAKSSFQKLLENDAALALRYAHLCNVKIQFLLKRIEHLTMQSSSAKLIEFLFAHADDENLVSLSFSKEHLAKVLGISRTALYRQIAELEKNGLLEVHQQYIQLVDPAKLTRKLYQ